MTTPQPAALPELPRETVIAVGKKHFPKTTLSNAWFGFAADIALATLQAQAAQPAEVSDAEIERCALESGFSVESSGAIWAVDGHVGTRVDPGLRKFARAILALRPQAESEQEKELRRSLAEAQATISERNAEIIELQKRIRRSPQAVPMTDAPFLKVHKGSICYKSVADDQSYGMWCPVNWDTEHGLKDGTVFYAHHGITAQGAQDGEVGHG